MPLNQETKAILPDVIIALRNAIESASLYPPDNPARIVFQEDAFGQLTRALKFESSLGFNAGEGSLLVNDDEPENDELKDSLGIAFARFLGNHRISRIIFRSGLQADEFRIFLECISKDEGHLNRAGGLAQLLKNQNINSVEITQITHEKDHRIAAKSKRIKEILRSMIAQYPGLQELIERGAQSMFRENPDIENVELSQTMNSLSSLLKNISEDAASLNDKAQMILELIWSIAGCLPKTGGRECDKLRAALANSFFSLEPQLKVMVIKKDLYSINAPGAIINDIITSASDQEIINLVCDNLQNNSLPYEDLADMLRVIFADVSREERLGCALEGQLANQGLSRQDIAIILNREFSLEKADFLFICGEFIKRACPGCWDVQQPGDVKAAIKGIVSQNKENELCSLVKALVSEYKAAQPEARLSAAHDLDNIMSILITTGRYRMLMQIIPYMSELLDYAGELKEYGLIVNLISETIKGLVYRENYLDAKALIVDLKHKETKCTPGQKIIIQNALSNIVNTRIKGSLITLFDHDMPYAPANILGVIAELGEPVVGMLIQMLEEDDITKAPAELYLKRRRITAILKKIGKAAVERLKDKLLKSRPSEAKNIIEALGYMDDRSVVALFAQMARQLDNSAREEMVNALKRLWCEECIDLLVMFLSDRDSKVRNRAGAVLAEMTDESDLPVLEHFLADSSIRKDLEGIIAQIRTRDSRSM